MGILNSLFGSNSNKQKQQRNERARRAREQQVQLKRAAGTAKARRRIGFDPALIGDLISDHSELVTIFGKVWSEGYEAKQYSKIASYLTEFKGLFQSHLLKENVKFYVYLEQTLGEDPHSLGVVRDFRKDMNGIANAVVGFCKKYIETELNEINVEQFVEDYQGIGEALVRRVKLEEQDLYSLYEPN